MSIARGVGFTVTDSVPTTTDIARWWSELDGGWRAVVLGAVLVAIVWAGVPIPW